VLSRAWPHQGAASLAGLSGSVRAEQGAPIPTQHTAPLGEPERGYIVADQAATEQDMAHQGAA
jgi:hypothetical protein